MRVTKVRLEGFWDSEETITVVSFDQARINSIRIKCVDPDSEEEEEWGRNSVTVFPDCDKRVTITSRLPLENGKIYNFRVTI